MFIEEFIVTPLQQNARIVACEKTGIAICIDPGDEAERIAASLDRHEFSLQAIALTHAHLDHICGVTDLKRIKPEATIILHAADESLYQSLPEQGASIGLSDEMLRSAGLNCEVPPPVERYWQDGESYKVGHLAFRVFHAPGHSPGHVLFYEAAEKKLIVGDCIFAGSIGRTDLPGGSFETLMHSIETKIMTLGDDVIIYTGHGPTTTVGRERRTNPFLTGATEGRTLMPSFPS